MGIHIRQRSNLYISSGVRVAGNCRNPAFQEMPRLFHHFISTEGKISPFLRKNVAFQINIKYTN